MDKKDLLVNSALIGIGLGLSAQSFAADGGVSCWGVNKCGAKSSEKEKANCSVTKEQVEAVKKAFPGKFKKMEAHSCSAFASCSAEKGNLNWTSIASKEQCKKIGGFLIDSSGKVEK